MKRAFVDGEYRKFQTKNKRNVNLLEGGDNLDGANEINFKSRYSEFSARDEPGYYLSENEEKNEYCCYDENGLFYDVYTIRMRVIEWNRNHNLLNMQEDDEEDQESIKRRKERVKRKECIRSMHGTANSQNKIDGDKKAIRMLQKIRNKKIRKSQKSDSTDFGAFFKEKGLKIPALKRSNSSFSQCHREKCVEK